MPNNPSQTTDDYASIARAMKDLDLKRDQPFATPLAPTWEEELNAKLQPKPVKTVDEWYGGC